MVEIAIVRSRRITHGDRVAVSDSTIHCSFTVLLDGAAHLLHAIANRVQNRQKTIRYVTAEQFTNEQIFFRLRTYDALPNIQSRGQCSID